MKKIIFKLYFYLIAFLITYIVFNTTSIYAYEMTDGWYLVPSETENKYEYVFYENGEEMMRKSDLSYAHRGWQTVPENTLVAFKQTREQGYYGFETDIRFTKDGIAVLCHDGTINRIARNPGTLTEIEEPIYVKDLTLEELYYYDFVVSSQGKVLEEYKGNKITTFEEALSYAKNNKMTIAIELKGGSESQHQGLVEMVRNYGMDNRVQWISFNLSLLKYVKKYDNDGYEFMRHIKSENYPTDEETISGYYNALKENTNNLVIIPSDLSGDPFNDVGFDGKAVNLPKQSSAYPPDKFDLSSKKITVKFNSDGGSSVQNQIVDYDKKATEPTPPTKNGCIFTGWKLNNEPFNFENRVTKNITLKASWVTAVPTTYTVNHYVHDLDATTYTLNSTDVINGYANITLTTASLAKSITGATYVEAYLSGDTNKPSSGAVENVIIEPDNLTTINLYYRRNYLYIQYNLNGGKLAETHGSTYGTIGKLVSCSSNKSPTKFLRGVYGSIVSGVNISTYATYSTGLHDYNNESSINAVRNGYRVLNKEEWKDSSGIKYNQASLKYSAQGFANADLSSGDAIVTLYINWIKNPKGDIDGNGIIDIIDVRLLLQNFINNATQDSDLLEIGDMNEDEVIDIIDVRLLLQLYINS